MTGIAVFGAGAVGGWHGAMLARAGERVTLIGRPALVDTVAEQGFRLGDEPVPLTASTDPAAVAGCDLVLVAVKSPDTAGAAHAIAPHLAPGAVLVSLQNGIGNAEVLARITGHPALPGLVYTALAVPEPGRVLHKGGGRLVLGDGPGAAAIADRFRRAGITAEVSPDISAALWTKLAVNCALNALSALTGQPYGPIAAHPGTDATLRAILSECRAVAGAEGVALPDDLLAQVHAVMTAMPGQHSSTAQDLAAGKPTEIAHLNGAVARRAEGHGIAAPLNAALALMVSLREG